MFELRLLRIASLAVAMALGAGLGAGCGPREIAHAPLGTAPETQRRVATGEIVGGIDAETGAHVWRGLPYAEPPIGELRWRPPLRHGSWSGVREALAYGSPCAQTLPAMSGAKQGEIRGGEDCLVLDVYAPPFAPGAVPRDAARLPVMVWIHGGGNVLGDASLSDGSLLATQRGVIVVALNYRLGPLGWFRHPALRDGAPEAREGSGNYANLDHIAALEWVRENVAVFGGDPGNVTVFGESAGGANVISLLISPLAKGLFQRAIVQSGGIASHTPGQAENYADDATEPGHAKSSAEVLAALLVADGSAKDTAAARALAGSWSAAKTSAYLRAVSPKDLIAVYAGGGGFGIYPMPKPIREGIVLPLEEPAAAIAAGRWNRVPVILGSNRDETRLFSLMDRRYSRMWFGVLPRLRDETRFFRDTSYGSRLWKASAVDELARAMRASGEARVYAYRFDWDELATPAGTDLPRMLGAAHGLDLGFTFGSWERGAQSVAFLVDDESKPGRDALASAMTSYWSEFARSGNPGRGRDGALPEWRAWDESALDTPRLLVLDTENDGGIRMSTESISLRRIVDEIGGDPRFESRAERCAYLDELAPRNPRVAELGREVLSCSAPHPDPSRS